MITKHNQFTRSSIVIILLAILSAPKVFPALAQADQSVPPTTQATQNGNIKAFIEQISLGGGHTCGLRTDGGLDCWGNNEDGQSDALPLPAGITYTQVSAGNFHTCGLRSDDSLNCWGNNVYGQAYVPPLTGLTYTHVGASNYHTCGLRSDGSLDCWGNNNQQQTDVPDPSGYGQDSTPLIVSKIDLANASPTLASSVVFTITFSEFVVGVNTADFTTHVTGGISGHSITAVSGSGAVYTVTVSTGSGEGTLRLDVIDNDSIRDAVNQPLGGSGSGNGGFAGGPAYTIGTISTTTHLEAIPNPARVGQVITFNTMVTAADGVPGGSMTFYNGTTLLGSRALTINSTATFTTTMLTAGAYTITAHYSGEGGFLPSTSNAVSLAVKPNAIYLPLALNDYMSHFEREWELEPNNNYLQANGPLVFSQAYYAYPDDAKDYFSFYLPEPGALSIEMSKHTGTGVQMLLYDQIPVAGGEIKRAHDVPYNITCNTTEGRYYLYIYSAGNYNSTSSYTLKVNTPTTAVTDECNQPTP